MNKTVILAIVFVVLVLIVVVYSTMGTNRYRCEVCIAFHDRSACRTAAAASEATEAGSGVYDSCMACCKRSSAAERAGEGRPAGSAAGAGSMLVINATFHVCQDKA